MSALIEFLNKTGLISKKGINTRLVDKLTKAQIIDLSGALTETTIPKTIPSIPPSVFNHFASRYSAGGRERCESISCRLGRLEDLLRFASLYSDNLYIHNFFLYYYHIEHDGANLDEDLLKQKFSEDLALI